jgi:hypothetical protein
MFIMNKYQWNKVFITIDVHYCDLNKLEGQIWHTVFYRQGKWAPSNANEGRSTHHMRDRGLLCVCCKCISCNWGVCTVYSCASWVHTHHSDSSWKQFRNLLLELLALWVGRMGHQHPPPESSSRRLQKLESLGYVASSEFEVLPMPYPAPWERAISSIASLCSNLGSTPSRWQTHCMPRCLRCWRI